MRTKPAQACPIFPGRVNRNHWGFIDPAHATGSEEEQIAVFRQVRDEIRRVFEAYAAGRRDEVTVFIHLRDAAVAATPG